MTPLGEGGIGIIRLMGPEAVRIADSVFRSKKGVKIQEAPADKLLYGHIEIEGERLDEVVVRVPTAQERELGAPAVDINCHGGIVAVRRVFEAILKRGARKASWEELVQASPSLDAIQREAALVLPRTLTRKAANTILAQYNGALSAEIRRMAGVLQRATWEESSRRVFDSAFATLRRLLASSSYGRGLWQPRRIVVAGPPNAGKSTLVNALLQKDRVLVHPEPGTTRDAIETFVEIGGIPFLLVDTAGLRRAGNEIEILGIEAARRQIHQADILLVVVDASQPLDLAFCQLLPTAQQCRSVLALNKSDLPTQANPASLEERLATKAVAISALNRTGLQELEARIISTLGVREMAEDAAIVFTERQERLLDRAADRMRKVVKLKDQAERRSPLREVYQKLMECLNGAPAEPQPS